MRAAEEAAFAGGVDVEALMDRAGAGVAVAVQKFFPRAGRSIVCVGKGPNGGDALVAAACLKEAGWEVDLRLIFPEEDLAEMTRKKLADFRRDELPLVRQIGRAEARPSELVILDGLLGLGAKHLLREPVRTAAQEINRLRREENAFVFAVGLPPGIYGDTGDTHSECLVAE